VTAEQLSYVATIGEEITLEPGAVLFNEGDAPSGLYVVISGSIAVPRGGNTIETIGPNGSLGIWGLFDNQPQLATAKAAERSQLFFVARTDFYEVLSNHVDIIQSVFKQLVQRVRRLAALTEKKYGR
jgi:CRP-like cAMP-binding protein